MTHSVYRGRGGRWWAKLEKAGWRMDRGPYRFRWMAKMSFPIYRLFPQLWRTPFVIVACALMLSGCVSLFPIIGGASTFGGGIWGGAGQVVGGSIARSELAWFRQWRKCRRQFVTHAARQRCMDRWRRDR
jgi:hypothetical protein